MDLGHFEKSKGLFQKGVMDFGLPRKSKVPSKRGGLDLGLAKIPDPFSRGGVVQSDVNMTLPRDAPNGLCRSISPVAHI